MYDEWLEKINHLSFYAKQAIIFRIQLRLIPILAIVLEDRDLCKSNATTIVFPCLWLLAKFEFMLIEKSTISYASEIKSLLKSVSKRFEFEESPLKHCADSYTYLATLYTSESEEDLSKLLVSAFEAFKGYSKQRDILPELFKEISFDIAKFNQKENVPHLLMQPLWNLEANEMPPYVRTKWGRMKNKLVPLNQKWEVWISWYEKIQNGSKLLPEFQNAITMTAPNQLVLAYTINTQISKEYATWTERRVRKLRESWYKGLSAKQIANNLKVSRNAVLSKAKRLGLIEPEISPIPVQKPASVNAKWVQNKIQINVEPALSSIDEKTSINSLLAVKASFESFLANIDKNSNIDQRFTRYLQTTIEKFPIKAPTNLELHDLIIREKVLLEYLQTTEQEWSAFQHSEYFGICLSFSRSLDQFGDRREFDKALLNFELDGKSVSEIEGDLKSILRIFKGEAGRKRIDPKIPELIEEIGLPEMPVYSSNPKSSSIKNSEVAILVDKLESSGNTIKAVAERMMSDGVSKEIMSEFEPEYLKGLEEGLRSGAKIAGKEDGEKIAKTAIRSKAAHDVTVASVNVLSEKYPSIYGWIKNVFKR